MTRKARRKLLSQHAPEVRRRPVAPWLAVLAGAALGHAQPARLPHPDLGDPRLHLIHEALESRPVHPSAARIAAGRERRAGAGAPSS